MSISPTDKLSNTGLGDFFPDDNAEAEEEPKLNNEDAEISEGEPEIESSNQLEKNESIKETDQLQGNTPVDRVDPEDATKEPSRSLIDNEQQNIHIEQEAPIADDEFGGFEDDVKEAEPLPEQKLEITDTIKEQKTGIDPIEVPAPETVEVPVVTEPKDKDNENNDKKVSFSDIDNPNSVKRTNRRGPKTNNKENSNVKNKEQKAIGVVRPEKGAHKEVQMVEEDLPKLSIDDKKKLRTAKQNLLKDKTALRVNITNFNPNKPVELPDPKPLTSVNRPKKAKLQDKLKLFVTKKSTIAPIDGTIKQDQEQPHPSPKDTLRSISKRRLNSSYHMPFDEVSYLEKQLQMAEVDRMRLKENLLTVEESIMVLKANIQKAKNKKEVNRTPAEGNLTESSMLIIRLDKMRKEQQERTLKLRQKTQAEQENILKQLEEQHREREERYSREKRARIVASIDRIKERGTSRKKQLLVTNKVIKKLMQEEDQVSAYFRHKVDNSKALNSSFAPQ